MLVNNSCLHEYKGLSISPFFLSRARTRSSISIYRSCEVALARTSARELGLDIVLGQGQARGAAVDDTSDAFAV